MLIIIEGPDGSGKTTLINNLIQSKRYFVTTRNSGPPRSFLDIARFLNFLENAPPQLRLICDRHPCISDRIYGPTLRNMDLLRDKPSTWMLSKADLIVYCRPPVDTVLENVAASKGTQLGGVLENCSVIINGYDKLMGKLMDAALPIVKYDYEQDTFDSLVAQHLDPILERA